MVDKLELTEKMPASGKVKKVVIFLHGYGADGADLISLSDPLSKQLPDCFFSAPNAPRKCGASPFGFEWFPIPEIDGSTIPSMMEALAKSEKLLKNLIQDYIAKFTLNSEDIALVGFSQGTMISLNIGLRGKNILGGIVGFSGRLLMPDVLKSEKKSKYPPVLLVHGDADDVVPISFLHEATKSLEDLGINFSTHISKNVGHGIAPDGLEKCSTFLQKVLA